MRRVRLTHAMKMDDPLVVGDTNQELRLPDYVAAMVVKLGNGVYLDGEPQLGPVRAEKEEKIAAGTLTQVSEESSQSEPAEREEVKKPYGNAPKSAWVRYACAVDEKMSEERAEGMTKADLMSRYGER